jgi:hypothetical protein
MPRLWQALADVLSNVKKRLRPARPEPPAPPPPNRETRPPQTRAAKPPYDLAKDTSTDNQKYLM